MDPITVKQLIALLQTLPGNGKVILSRDEEGTMAPVLGSNPAKGEGQC